MNKKLILFVALIVSGAGNGAFASDITDMIGKWKWEGFTIKVVKCATTDVCAEVVSGPKNVGMQMIKSKLTRSGSDFLGKIAHPQTGDTYNTKISMTDPNTWHMDGCTDKNVCASGDFKRIK